MRTLVAAVIGGLALAAAQPAVAQDKIELKVAYFVGDQHPMSQWIVRWTEKLAADSGGRITIKRFPNSQMAPAPAHYDLARTGQADIVWYLAGGTPGRFPLTELISLPYMVGSAEIGTKVLNDKTLREKYLDAEHKGVKVLFLLTHQPGQIHTSKKAVRTVDDMKGLRIRFASPSVRDFVAALGATPVGVPPTEQAEQLQKGTIDGVFIDYGGAGIAFKLGGIVKHSTEMYSFVTSFGVVMNPDTYAKLPADLKKLIDDSVAGREKEIGLAWDTIDGPGKKLLIDGGGEAIQLAPAEDAKFRKIGADVNDAAVKALEAKGLPGRAVYDMMKSLSEKHAKDSKSFWQK